MKLSLIMAAKLYKSLKVYKNKNEQRLYDMSDLRINHKKNKSYFVCFSYLCSKLFGYCETGVKGRFLTFQIKKKTGTSRSTHLPKCYFEECKVNYLSTY